VIGRGKVARGQIEHRARQLLARTLERTGPLTAAGLAREVKRPRGWVSHHLKVLARAGVVMPFGGCQVAGEEIAYALTLEQVPKGAQEVLLGEHSPEAARGRAEVGPRVDIEGEPIAPEKFAAWVEYWLRLRDERDDEGGEEPDEGRRQRP
jgi:hypothetical protein